MAKLLWVTEDGITFDTLENALDYEVKFSKLHVSDVAKIKIKEILPNIDDMTLNLMIKEANGLWGILDEYMRDIENY